MDEVVQARLFEPFYTTSPGVLFEMAGVTASLWGALVLAAIAGVVAMFLPPVAVTEVSWALRSGMTEASSVIQPVGSARSSTRLGFSASRSRLSRTKGR
jgi:hypothetical protein